MLTRLCWIQSAISTPLASQLWSDYLSGGPGSLDSKSFEPVAATAEGLMNLLHQSETTLDCAVAEHTICKICELAQRCACRLEGLCFITGEAGLIPRKQDHESYETALNQLEQLIGQLEGPVH